MAPKDKGFLLCSASMVAICLAAGYFIHWGVGAVIFIGFLASISGGSPNDITPEAEEAAELARRRLRK